MANVTRFLGILFHCFHLTFFFTTMSYFHILLPHDYDNICVLQNQVFSIYYSIFLFNICMSIYHWVKSQVFLAYFLNFSFYSRNIRFKRIPIIIAKAVEVKVKLWNSKNNPPTPIIKIALTIILFLLLFKLTFCNDLAPLIAINP